MNVSVASQRVARQYCFVIGLIMASGAAWGWDAHGHRTITSAALDALPQELPAFLRDAELKAQIASNANEPDRIRNITEPAITHINGPDHYLNIEKLYPYGLSLETIPRLRYDYLGALVLARDHHPEKIEPYKPERDPKRANEWPGFLPYAIEENYGRLVSGFRALRVMEALPPAVGASESVKSECANELERARRMIAVQIGMLSHYVGDAAQPLHTTAQYNGWTGPNPQGYTESRKFHGYIDGGVLSLHKIDLAAVEAKPIPDHNVGKDVWPAIISHIKRSFDTFVPLYELQKSGALNKDEGKEFILERLRDGSGMLRDLIVAAWHAAEPKPKDLENDPKWDRPTEPDPVLSGQKPPEAKAAPK